MFLALLFLDKYGNYKSKFIKKYKKVESLGKSQLGGSCDRNGDCENKGSVCLRGRCRCHPHYAEVVDEKGRNPHCKRRKSLLIPWITPRFSDLIP